MRKSLRKFLKTKSLISEVSTPLPRSIVMASKARLGLLDGLDSSAAGEVSKFYEASQINQLAVSRLSRPGVLQWGSFRTLRPLFPNAGTCLFSGHTATRKTFR